MALIIEAYVHKLSHTFDKITYRHDGFLALRTKPVRLIFQQFPSMGTGCYITICRAGTATVSVFLATSSSCSS